MKSKSREHNSWRSMKARCLNKNIEAYKNYGGRGILICQEWVNNFAQFCSDMGARPEGTSLGRRDNSKGYSPDNCRWETDDQQKNNTRQNVLIEHNGKTQTATQWAKDIGIQPGTLLKRINQYKKSPEEALTVDRLNKWRHGTRAGYEMHKCRCDLCRASNAKRHRDRRKKINERKTRLGGSDTEGK